MTDNRFPRLRRLCAALPKTKHDEYFESLSAVQQVLVFVVTSAIVLTVPPLLIDSPDARISVAVPLAIGVFYAVSELLARYNRR